MYVEIDGTKALVNRSNHKRRCLPQVVIQLRKFAEAVRRIKAAVSPDASPGRAQPRMTGPRAVLSADVSDMLRTELSGIDPSVLGAPSLTSACGLSKSTTLCMPASLLMCSSLCWVVCWVAKRMPAVCQA